MDRKQQIRVTEMNIDMNVCLTLDRGIHRYFFIYFFKQEKHLRTNHETYSCNYTVKHKSYPNIIENNNSGAVISIARCLIDISEHAALYKINNKLYIKFKTSTIIHKYKTVFLAHHTDTCKQIWFCPHK